MENQIVEALVGSFQDFGFCLIAMRSRHSVLRSRVTGSDIELKGSLLCGVKTVGAVCSPRGVR